MEESKYLKLARQAREDNNTEDAKKFYDMARVEDPENIEAKFFYAYYNLNDAINRDVPNKFVDYTKAAVSSVKLLITSTLADKQKKELLKEIVAIHERETVSIPNYVLTKIERTDSNGISNGGIYSYSEYSMVENASMKSLEEMGNTIANAFGDDETCMSYAVALWKQIFNHHSQAFFTKSAGTADESAKKWHELVEKIQKVDPSFPTPKEPFVLKCGKK